ncbi:MAG: hypothetical protein GY835_21090 [bacterium]|nr:hypothetical protein [bacterium]
MMRRMALGVLLISFAVGSCGAMELKPLLYSALIPGLGEWSLGYKKRAVGHWVVEAGCWAGNFYYREQGFDARHRYEAFAREHWDSMHWASSWSDEMPVWLEEWFTEQDWNDAVKYAEPFQIAMEFEADHPGYLESHYAAFQDDSQHYYENIGKYNWYRWGWDDYDVDADYSVNRYRYTDLRNESNDNFNRAHKFITLMIVARVVSLADTFILLHRLESNPDLDASGDWHLDFEPTNIVDGGFRVALTRSW